MSSPSPEVPFEQALAHLEGVVTRLESGELSLEESLRCFEEGIALQRRCIAQLNAAQQRIEVLQDEAAPPVDVDRLPGAAGRQNGLSLAFEEASPGG